MDRKALGVVRYVSLGLIAVFAFGLLAIGLGWLQSARSPLPSPSAGGPVVGAFRLVDHTNRAVSERDVLGRPAVMFFGFTHCPDVCPTTLASMSGLMGRMGGDADRLGVYFVSVDPERDTPEELARYLSAFDPRIRGLTGAPDQVAALAKSLGIYYARVKIQGGYTMDHTASVILLDAQGRFTGTIAYGENNDTALAKLRLLAGG
jgi:protein SCO1/2